MTLTKKDTVTFILGEWFDEVNGNTYNDATIEINGVTHYIPYKYGYGGASEWVIKEYLQQIGYRIRTGKKCKDYITVYTKNKLKRDLNK